MLKIILFFLGKGIRAGYKLDSNIKQLINSLGNNFIVKIGILNKKIFLTFWQENGKVYIKHSIASQKIEENLTIMFKNEAQAKMVLFGKMSVEEAFAKHFFVVYGDIASAMTVVPLLETVERYLFLKGMNARLFKNNEQKLQVSKFRFLLKTLIS